MRLFILLIIVINLNCVAGYGKSNYNYKLNSTDSILLNNYEHFIIKFHSDSIVFRSRCSNWAYNENFLKKRCLLIKGYVDTIIDNKDTSDCKNCVMKIKYILVPENLISDFSNNTNSYISVSVIKSRKYLYFNRIIDLRKLNPNPNYKCDKIQCVYYYNLFDKIGIRRKLKLAKDNFQDYINLQEL